MRGTHFVLVVLAALPLLGGCAASRNLFEKDQCKVYGGTRVDMTLISQSVTPDSEAAQIHGMARPALAWGACCGLVDLPLSIVADTLTLPVTVPASISRANAETSDEESSEPDSAESD